MSHPTIRAGSAPAIISPELIALDADLGTTKDAVIDALAHRLAADGRTSDVDALKAAALARESQSATGLPGGIAIPHCRDASIATASLGFARLSPKVDFGAPDGPADLVFLIAAPEGAGSEHMKLLSSLARALVKPAFVASLRAAATPNDVVALVEEVLAPATPPVRPRRPSRPQPLRRPPPTLPTRSRPTPTAPTSRTRPSSR